MAPEGKMSVMSQRQGSKKQARQQEKDAESLYLSHKHRAEEHIGSGIRLNTQRQNPSHIFPAAMSHFITPPQNSATSWGPSVKCLSLWGTILIQNTTTIIYNLCYMKFCLKETKNHCIVFIACLCVGKEP